MFLLSLLSGRSTGPKSIFVSAGIGSSPNPHSNGVSLSVVGTSIAFVPTSEIFQSPDIHTVAICPSFTISLIRASSMKTAIGGGHPEDTVLSTAQISKGVFAGHYNLPLVDGTVSESDTDASTTMVGAAAMECLLENSVSASTASAPITIANSEQACLTDS